METPHIAAIAAAAYNLAHTNADNFESWTPDLGLDALDFDQRLWDGNDFFDLDRSWDDTCNSALRRLATCIERLSRGIEWADTSVMCPGCGQAISYVNRAEPGKLECGGDGQGICCAASDSTDLLSGRNAAPRICEYCGHTHTATLGHAIEEAWKLADAEGEAMVAAAKAYLAEHPVKPAKPAKAKRAGKRVR